MIHFEKEALTGTQVSDPISTQMWTWQCRKITFRLTKENICTATWDVLEFPFINTWVYVFREQLWRQGNDWTRKDGYNRLPLHCCKYEATTAKHLQLCILQTDMRIVSIISYKAQQRSGQACCRGMLNSFFLFYIFTRFYVWFITIRKRWLSGCNISVQDFYLADYCTWSSEHVLSLFLARDPIFRSRRPPSNPAARGLPWWFEHLLHLQFILKSMNGAPRLFYGRKKTLTKSRITDKVKW